MTRQRDPALGRKTRRAVGVQYGLAVKCGTLRETARHVFQPNIAPGIESSYRFANIFRSFGRLAPPTQSPFVSNLGGVGVGCGALSRRNGFCSGDGAFRIIATGVGAGVGACTE